MSSFLESISSSASLGSSTYSWIKFFTDAGIPNAIAANYAVSFTDNRIQKEMLIDLDKECLKDMGITAMGDILAILKHAKRIHAENERIRAMQLPSSANNTPSVQKNPLVSSTQDQLISPTSIPSPMSTLTKAVQEAVSSIAENERKRAVPRSAPVKKQVSPKLNLSSLPPKLQPKATSTPTFSVRHSSVVTRVPSKRSLPPVSPSPVRKQTPVKKVRLVEPVDNSTKSRLAGRVTSNKSIPRSVVFNNRMVEGSDEDSDEDINNISEDLTPRITITGFESNIVFGTPRNDLAKKSSVFSRLGSFASGSGTLPKVIRKSITGPGNSETTIIRKPITGPSNTTVVRKSISGPTTTTVSRSTIMGPSTTTVSRSTVFGPSTTTVSRKTIAASPTVGILKKTVGSKICKKLDTLHSDSLIESEKKSVRLRLGDNQVVQPAQRRLQAPAQRRLQEPPQRRLQGKVVAVGRVKSSIKARLGNISQM